METFLSILLVVFFVLVNAFFSGTEMAVISLNDAKMHKLAEEGDRKALRVIKFLDNPGNFLATIQVGVTLAGFLSSAFAANSFASKLALLVDPSSKYVWMESLWTVVITIVLSYFSLVLGELVPKRIAQNKPERWAFAAANVVKFFGAVLKPFVWFLTKSTNVILRLFRIDPNQTDKPVTEEEIRMMVDVGSESGNIEDTEKEMIENVFEFNDKEVSEIMTHRKKIVSLPIDADYDEVMRVAREEKFTRIPVYKDTIDDIIGILHIKDLIGIMPPTEEEPFKLEKFIREPLIVHETRKISSLFGEMKNCGMQMAVIVDEYGGMIGLVTIEDLAQQIIGSIQDYGEEDEQPVHKSPNEMICDGKTAIREIEDFFDIEIDNEGFETIAGLVLKLAGHIPKAGEFFKSPPLKLTVLKTEQHRISKVKIVKIPT